MKVVRKEYCPKCKENTTFAIHGFDEEGKLWKGHVCECGCWQCLKCKHIYKPFYSTDKNWSWECCR